MLSFFLTAAAVLFIIWSVVFLFAVITVMIYPEAVLCIFSRVTDTPVAEEEIDD